MPNKPSTKSDKRHIAEYIAFVFLNIIVQVVLNAVYSLFMGTVVELDWGRLAIYSMRGILSAAILIFIESRLRNPNLATIILLSLAVGLAYYLVNFGIGMVRYQIPWPMAPGTIVYSCASALAVAAARIVSYSGANAAINHLANRRQKKYW
ncbi:MAG: hypothetical protein JSS71_03735 [Armatimonadetes bacterium]|nr:hypothetical protein [Armatimonadota bacterium]MBX3108494.1 hypothetical protein [Fimbriimonadaceae bacterium]